MDKLNLLGYSFVSDENFKQIIIEIMNYKDMIDGKCLPIVATPNVDQLVNLEKSEELKNMIQNSYLILPDGKPIVWLSQLVKKPLRSRLSGSDLFPRLWQELIKQKKKTLLIVPSEQVRKKLFNEEPSFIYYVPSYFDLNNKQEYQNELISIENIIQKNNPEYIIIGLSYPKREYLCKSLLELSNRRSLYLLLGASFEFYLGMKKRAPVWIQNLGFEWLHRFFNEPRRLFKRYFIDSWYFLYLVFKETRMKRRGVEGN